MLVVGYLLGRAEKKDSVTLDQVTALINQSRNTPQTLDDLLENKYTGATEPPKPDPIVDIKVGAVKRPSAEKLWAKEHPDEAAEMDEMRKGLKEVIPAEEHPIA